MWIDFRPVDDLEEVVHRLDVSPHEPSHMCAVTSSPSQLLYCKRSKVHRVDCSTVPPTRREIDLPIVHDRRIVVRDMCTSHDLMVVARGFDRVLTFLKGDGGISEGVFTYSLPGGELKWKVSGKLPGMQREINARGVTADEQGHLFVCGVNNRCVHLLSARDGTHLGVVVRKGQEVVGKPTDVTWHQESKSLVMAHVTKSKGNISIWHLSIFSCQE